VIFLLLYKMQMVFLYYFNKKPLQEKIFTRVVMVLT